MPRYVALLGSINVGGNRLAMADLKAALDAEGFADVATVVASGNALFSHEGAGDTASLASRIEAIVRDRFAIASFVAVRTRGGIASAIADNPFVRDGEAKYVHTLFLEHSLASDAVEAFTAGFDGPERIAGNGGRELFIDYATGVARSKIDPALKKARLITGRATARNIRSLQRILDTMDV